MTIFADIFKSIHFCVKQYIDFQNKPVWGTLKVLPKSLKTVFDEDLFIKKFALSNSNQKWEDDFDYKLGYIYFR